jgi:ComF family protein
LFDGAVRELIHQFKYSGKTMLRRPLALLAADHLDRFVIETGPDVIIPVPLHHKRLRQRGFNQAILLGEIFAQKWRLPLLRNSLRRVRWTEPQVNLSAAERLENVKGAFALADIVAVAGKRVLLVDDVYTTGSTVKECAKVLKSGGAQSVTAITVARAAE